MKNCSVEEKDALMSIVNREHPEEYGKRYSITYANAIQRRRRILQRVKSRFFSENLERHRG